MAQTKKDVVLETANAAYWALNNKLMIRDGVPFSFKNHEFQLDWLVEDHPCQCWIKGAQLGATNAAQIKVTHGILFKKYIQDVMYLFPTSDEIQEYVKGRYNPFIEANPKLIKQYIRNTDSTTMKQINNVFFYFRGTRGNKTISTSDVKESSKLRSTPCDCLIFDEYDLMDMDMVEQSYSRLLHSTLKERLYLSTPTIPGFGIDKLYKKSDMRNWYLQCDHCSIKVGNNIVKPQYTCMELEFPSNLKRVDDNTVIRACKYCGKELNVTKGKWIAQYPNRKDMVGWWVSHLSMSFTDPKIILDKYEDVDTKPKELYNSLLGMPYINKSNQLSEVDVYSKCGRDPMVNMFQEQSAAGIDVGKTLHVVIGCKTSKNVFKILKCVRLKDINSKSAFDELHDLFYKMNVRSFVIDKMPETRRVREFIQYEKNRNGYLCEYHDEMSGDARWNPKVHEVHVNKTEICDRSHNIVVGSTSEQVELPRKNEEIVQFAKEMCGLVRTINQNSNKALYVPTGDDHYRNAFNYFLLAADRIKPVDRTIKNEFIKKSSDQPEYLWC